MLMYTSICHSYGRGELKALVKLLGVEGQTNAIPTTTGITHDVDEDEGLLRDEISIIHGALEVNNM